MCMNNYIRNSSGTDYAYIIYITYFVYIYIYIYQYCLSEVSQVHCSDTDRLIFI